MIDKEKEVENIPKALASDAECHYIKQSQCLEKWNSNLALVLLTVGHLVRNKSLGNKNGCP